MGRASTLLTWALALGVGLRLGRLLRGWLDRRRRRLREVVSQSSRVITGKGGALLGGLRQPLRCQGQALSLQKPR